MENKYRVGKYFDTYFKRWGVESEDDSLRNDVIN